ncbi:MAG: SUMF1/EgtB/PvdO family nonheme iron enzyme, partial [Chloroflexi bacterium]|nr:SUMF1/EgtB/PvdO family nonheme iron enzyme [Chloroflexota bacterium]
VYSGNSGGQTAPVGSRPNGVSWVGAFDLSGNLFEWVNDWSDPGYYATLAAGVVDPQGPASGIGNVLRGGSWGTGDSFYLRAADRGRGVFDGYDFGFRCARSMQ